MADKISVLIPEEEIEKRIDELAEQINKDYEGTSLHLICVLKGSMFFTCALAKRLKMPVTIDTMSVSSYGSGTESTGRLKIVKDLDESVKDRDVLIVEDIIDFGVTLENLVRMIGQREPKSVKICTLLNKPDRRIADVQEDYCGFVIPNKFVVGYGLDYAQKYRNLPYIGVVELDAGE